MYNVYMQKMFLDIEAVPIEKEFVFKPTFKDKILRHKPKKPTPLTQKIVCIGYAINNEETKIFSGDEKEILQKFWESAKEMDLFVGFGVFDYDLKLIWQRSIVHSVKPTQNIEFAKKTSKPIYDIAYEWSKWTGGIGSKISLDNLAKLLGLPSPKVGDVNGRTVAKAFNDGRHAEIYEYCKRDVQVTRDIYKRMIFEK